MDLGLPCLVAACILAACHPAGVASGHSQVDVPVLDAVANLQVAPSPSEAYDLFMLGAYDRAREIYQQLENDPLLRSDAILGIGRCDLQCGRYDEGLIRLGQLDASDRPEWQLLAGQLLYRLGRYDESAARAQSAIKLDANQAEARLLIGQLLELRGKRDDALEAYRWFDEQLVVRAELPRDPAWMTAAAVGFLRYSILTQTEVVSRTKYVLRDLLQFAYTKLDRTYWPARIAAAELLRQKYNNDETDGSISDYLGALRINPNLPEAHVGIGEAALNGWHFEEVEERIDKALKVNPNFAEAHHLSARKFIAERRYTDAILACDRALTVNAQDMTALSLRAAAASCRYDEPMATAMRVRVEAVNPRPAPFHRIVGNALSGIRQYAESEAQFLKAIEFDPTDANPRTELGMMYMQWGHEDRARDALDAAWNLDSFNERTKFTLDLLDMLQKFARVETDHFIVRYDAKRDPGLGAFMADYLEEIYEPITKDFGTVLTDKTLIEVFPSQKAFAVRITGQPWIHTMGACTGRVIALASPRKGEDRIGPYNLARVLKHEFTHTVTLAATQNRIPHWFTEGLAVYQEDSPRGFDSWELLAEAIRRDRLFTLESIDWGFMRPQLPQDRSMAYAQSEWMCEFIIDRFGYDAIGAMIQRYRKGQTQPQVLREQLGVEPEVFDREFRSWARTDIARWGFELAPPEDLSELQRLAAERADDAEVLGRLAKAAFDQGEYELALNAAGEALKLKDDDPNALSALTQILAVRARVEKSAQSRQHYENELLSRLDKLASQRPNDWMVPKLQAEVLLRRKEWDQAVQPLMRLKQLCPLDPMSWRGLAGVYLKKEQWDQALPMLLELARSEEHDADVPEQIGDIYKRRSQFSEARFWYRQALFIDPFRVPAHEALGDAAMQAGETRAALLSYSMLTKLEPQKADHYEKAAMAAHKLGNSEEALSFAAQAVNLNPQSTARNLLPP